MASTLDRTQKVFVPNREYCTVGGSPDPGDTLIAPDSVTAEEPTGGKPRGGSNGECNPDGSPKSRTESGGAAGTKSSG